MAWYHHKLANNDQGNVRGYTPGIPTYHIYLDEITTQERPKMSTALWCDKGEHAFSAKDPEKQHFTKTQEVQVETGNSYGARTYQPRMEITEELDICGPCWKSGNVFSEPKAINGDDKPPKTLEELQEEDENYRMGYNAAMEKILNRPMTEDEKEKVNPLR